MRRRNEMVYTLALVLVDLLALFEAFNLSYEIRAGQAKPLAHMMEPYQFALVMLAVMPGWALIFGVCGLYGSYQDRKLAADFARVIVAVAGGVMTLIVVDYARLGAVFPSRSVPFIAYGLGVAFVMIGRLGMQTAARELFARGVGLHNVIAVGVGQFTEQIIRDLDRRRGGYNVVAIVNPSGDQPAFVPDVPVFATLAEATAAADQRQVPIDEVVQADAGLEQKLVMEMIGYCTRRGISYRFVPSEFGSYASHASFGTLGGVPVMEVRFTPLEGWGRLTKRASDTLGAIIAIAIAAPVLAAIWLVMKLTEPTAPVLYRQERIGRGSRPIAVFKFRSMNWAYSTGPDRPYKNQIEVFKAMGRDDLIAEFERDHKVADDPRVTKLGRILRATSLDELPQLFNVLKGELSLVGPRPITVDEYKRYGDGGPSYLALKPGITGLWQVSGRSDLSYDERVRLDVQYVENWSLRLDASILLRTVATVIKRSGAY